MKCSVTVIDGDSVIDRSQVIVTTTNADGFTTDTWTDYMGNQKVKPEAPMIITQHHRWSARYRAAKNAQRTSRILAK